jgi:hypothetical protein
MADLEPDKGVTWDRDEGRMELRVVILVRDAAPAFGGCRKQIGREFR